MPRPRLDCSALTLSGSICALLTPFGDDGRLDVAAFERLIEHQIAGGSHGLVIAGSTGEAAMLDEAEYGELLTRAVGLVAGRVPVLAGTGAPATAQALRQTLLARDCGVDAALVATPSYVRPTQDGLYRHYRLLADQGGLPLLLYNVPGRTACDLLPETVARLAGHPRVIGIKEALADPDRIGALLRLQDDGFVVLSGDDPTFVASMAAGARGVVSVAANVVPGALSELCDHARAGRTGPARELDAELHRLYAFLGVESNPIPAKWLVHRLGLCGPGVRMPLTPLSSQWHAQADEVLAGVARWCCNQVA